MAEPITMSTADLNGYKPDLTLLGNFYQHSGSGDIYRIVGFTFGADSDEWAVRYRRRDGMVTFTRTVVGFFGTREGVDRFIHLPDMVDDDDNLRDEIAAILETIAKDGLPGPRDLDVALDAIFASMRGHD